MIFLIALSIGSIGPSYFSLNIFFNFAYSISRPEPFTSIWSGNLIFPWIHIWSLLSRINSNVFFPATSTHTLAGICNASVSRSILPSVTSCWAKITNPCCPGISANNFTVPCKPITFPLTFTLLELHPANKSVKAIKNKQILFIFLSHFVNFIAQFSTKI